MPPNFPLPSQAVVLRIPGISLPTFPYGAITLYGGPFQATSGQWARECPGPLTPHPFLLIARKFGLPSSPFPRRYSGNRDCFLFLPLLRCFNSGGSLSQALSSGVPAEAGRIPIRGSADQRLHAATRGLSQLATPFLGLPSPAIHQAA